MLNSVQYISDYGPFRNEIFMFLKDNSIRRNTIERRATIGIKLQGNTELQMWILRKESIDSDKYVLKTKGSISGYIRIQ